MDPGRLVKDNFQGPYQKGKASGWVAHEESQNMLMITIENFKLVTDLEFFFGYRI